VGQLPKEVPGTVTPNAVTTLPGGFTHVATYPDQALVAYKKPDHSQPIAQSRYGVTSLFQGRGWHEELGLYYFRARWYSPGMGSFLERDPKDGIQPPNLFQFEPSGGNLVDPFGESGSTPDDSFEYDVNSGSLREVLQAADSSIFGKYVDGFSRYVRLGFGGFEQFVVARHGVDGNRRWSLGISRDFSLALPEVGVRVGDNLQVFVRPDNQLVAGIYVFETPSNLDIWKGVEKSLLGFLKILTFTEPGPSGVTGLNLGVSVNGNYAINISSVDNFGYSDSDLVKLWDGVGTTEWTGSVEGLDGSYFENSGFWAGFSFGPSLSANPIGGHISKPVYHLRIGPLSLSSMSDLFAIELIYGSFAHLHPAVQKFLGGR